MKKFISLILLLAITLSLVLALASCGEENTTPSEETQTSTPSKESGGVGSNDGKPENTQTPSGGGSDTDHSDESPID